ncbi:5296_t:CDS:2, partial [Funneliformis caledonium]
MKPSEGVIIKEMGVIMANCDSNNISCLTSRYNLQEFLQLKHQHYAIHNLSDIDKIMCLKNRRG